MAMTTISTPPPIARAIVTVFLSVSNRLTIPPPSNNRDAQTSLNISI